LIGETSAERALGRELRSYRRRAARLLLAGFVLLGFGIVLAFFFTPSDTAPRNDLWLYRTYGESGLVWGPRGLGALTMLLAIWLFYIAAQRLTVGVRAREAGSRKVLGLSATSSPPRPSQVGLLVGILVAVVAVAALYLLTR
jgi:uncharacterized membrane protein HdeD (DUF308 family)